MKEKTAVEIVKCADCGKTMTMDDIEIMPNGELVCFDCLNYTMDFGEEEN